MKNFFKKNSIRFAQWMNVAIVPIISFLFIPAAFAQNNFQTAPKISLTPNSVILSLCNAVNWMFYILIILSVIMVLVAAYVYVTASGDPEKASKARMMILYAAIGVVVALLAKGFPSTVGSFLGQSVSSCTASS